MPCGAYLAAAGPFCGHPTVAYQGAHVLPVPVAMFQASTPMHPAVSFPCPALAGMPGGCYPSRAAPVLMQPVQGALQGPAGVWPWPALHQPIPCSTAELKRQLRTDIEEEQEEERRRRKQRFASSASDIEFVLSEMKEWREWKASEEGNWESAKE